VADGTAGTAVVAGAAGETPAVWGTLAITLPRNEGCKTKVLKTFQGVPYALSLYA